MNELQIFSSPEFGELRTIEEGDKIYFVASDVAKALGYKRPADAVSAHCRYTVKRSIPHPQGKGTLQMNVIPEGDVYRLAAHSELPSAEKFESWVFDEVLPAIRKTGGYHVPQSPAEQMAQGILAAQKLLAERDATIAKQNEQIAVLTPKGVFADAVTASKTSILVGGLAKLIKQQGIDIGQKRLFAWMRENGFLIKSGTEKNMPTQRAMDLKLFEVKEGSFVDGNGVNRITRTTKVTGKGQVYFVNKFLNGSKVVLE